MSTTPRPPLPSSDNSPSPLPGDYGQKEANNSALPAAHKYDSSMGAVRALLFGKPLSSSLTGHQALPKFIALPIFSSDALSSVAYAAEAILGVLVLASTGALREANGIAISICALILIVSLSYRQIIFAYPTGGGAYPVGKENLGTIAALAAGASLLVDYILTVAVSVASGVDAVASFSSWVHGHTVAVCLIAILFITLANLRGVRESGSIFAWPTYIFIISLVAVIAVGSWQLVTGHAHFPSTAQMNALAHAHSMKIGTEMAGWYLILQAFSSGCSALTGLEAISNTVPYFQAPKDRNAAATMMWMCVIAIFLVFGMSHLAVVLHTLPLDENARDYQTVISQITHDVFDNTVFAKFYYVVQLSTAIVLVLAANTAFSGFPQLASMLAKDRFLPRQLASVGDRLVFANGIILLALAGCVLIMVFGGNVYELIPLYAVGVFTSFTIAQTGMVRRWLRLRTQGWQMGLTLNAIGAVATALVAIIFVVSKWASGVDISPSLVFPTDGIYQWYAGSLHHLALPAYRDWQLSHPGLTLPGFTIGPNLQPHYGAWIVAVLIPLLVMMFNGINRHYEDTERQLTLGAPEAFKLVNHTVVVLVPRLHRGVLEALRYGQTISSDSRALFVEIDESSTPKLKEQWENYAYGTPLIILASPFRSLFGPILRYVDAIIRDNPGQKLTIIVPESVSPKWWHNILHNKSGLLLKYILSGKRDVIVTNVRYFLEA